ncbi:HypC/HybG/HupF family hydrogenase formation chaperone [Longispora sp. K20-0274]|uniref:HypC/HybG/HupF family hydrogenase formation chaperone n=1 Tax=Longispora sp. K20-0274 TaxID=3088255 RepID=UPI00399AC6F7
MCLGIPGEIVEILADPDLALVDVSGVRRAINIGLIEEPLTAGDWILIHVGFALSKIDETEARSALDFLEGIGQAYADELAAFADSRIVEHDVFIPRPADLAAPASAAE